MLTSRFYFKFTFIYFIFGSNLMAKHWWDKFLLKEESKERVLLVDHFIEKMKSIAIQETGFIKQIHIAKLDKRDIYAYSLG